MLSSARLLALLLVLFVPLALAPAAHAQVAPGPEPGVVVTDRDLTKSLGDAKASGARWVKFFVPYSTSDPELVSMTETFREYSADGFKVILVLYGSSRGNFTPPPTTDEFRTFATKVASAAGPFVHGYMVWNEADGDIFWQPRPDVASYVGLLKAAYPAIKAADQVGSDVVSFTPLTGGNFPFLEEAYKLGAKGFFDVVGVDTDTACDLDSPYDLFREPTDNYRISRFVFLGYREVHNVMAANGEGSKKLWLEMGWSTSKELCNQGVGKGLKAGGVTEQQQAQFLREAYHCLREDQPPYVEAAFWFDLREPSGDGGVDNSFGLLRHNGQQKPAYFAFRDEFARGVDTVKGPCGDLVGPEIKITSPAPGQKLVENQPLKLSAGASDPRGIGRITFTYDGLKPIRSFTEADSPGGVATLDGWQGAKALPVGKHTLEVTVLDKNANPSFVTVEFEKVSAAAALALQTATRPMFTLGKVQFGKGRKCVLRGFFAGYPGLTAKNKVKVEWQWKNKQRKFKTLHKAQKAANKPFTFSQKLAKKGSWRVQVSFVGNGPYKTVKAKRLSFKVR